MEWQRFIQFSSIYLLAVSKVTENHRIDTHIAMWEKKILLSPNSGYLFLQQDIWGNILNKSQ